VHGGGACEADGVARAAAGRVVRVNISDPGPADGWQEVLAQHPRDQLTAATAVKARASPHAPGARQAVQLARSMQRINVCMTPPRSDR
jgi:hypothetical protein